MYRKKIFPAIIIIITLMVIGQACVNNANTHLKVAVSANAYYAVKEIARRFKAEDTVTIDLITGSSGKLATQIQQGAPFDIFISANMTYPQNLFSSHIAIEEPRIYARGKLILWTTKDITLLEGMQSLNKRDIKTIAIASPVKAPYGEAAIMSLKYFHLFDALKDKIVYAESVSQVNQFITSGTADIGFTAYSALHIPGKGMEGSWLIVDPASYSPIDQAAVILKHSRERQQNDAQKFFDYLFSKNAKSVFAEYGYEVE